MNRATGKPMLGKSEKLSAAEATALWELKEQSTDISEPLPITYRMHITFIFYCKDRRGRDLSNLLEFPQDCLQQAGIIANDSLIESLDGSRKFVDPLHPRTEIYIEKYDDGSEVPSGEETGRI